MNPAPPKSTIAVSLVMWLSIAIYFAAFVTPLAIKLWRVL
jgi:hypothetical protein